MTTKTCSNCLKEIKADNFLMHEGFCLRNIRPCEICKEPIDKSQKDEHFNEVHAKEKCECGELIEKQYLEKHKNDTCPKRKMQCVYCELELDQNKLAEHLAFCGSRTDTCELCNRYIQNKDRQRHEETNCTYPPVVVKNENPTISNRLNTTNYTNTNRQPTQNFIDEFYGSGTGSHLFESNFVNFDNIDSVFNSYFNGRSPRSARREPSTDFLIPCEFCDEILTLDELHVHQVSCKKNPDNFVTDLLRDSTIQTNTQTQPQSERRNLPTTSTERVRSSRITNVTNRVRCEFCANLYEDNVLRIHQPFCKNQQQRSNNTGHLRTAVSETRLNSASGVRPSNGSASRNNVTNRSTYIPSTTTTATRSSTIVQPRSQQVRNSVSRAAANTSPLSSNPSNSTRTPSSVTANKLYDTAATRDYLKTLRRSNNTPKKQ